MSSQREFPHESVRSTVQSIDDDITFKKISRRLIPLLFIIYLIACIDRVNVGIAQIPMKAELGFTDAIYGLGAGLFFLAYALFELPNSYLMSRIGAVKTIMLLTIGWGCISSLTMFVRTPTEFYVLRFMLGVLEAGFFFDRRLLLVVLVSAAAPRQGVCAFLVGNRDIRNAGLSIIRCHH